MKKTLRMLSLMIALVLALLPVGSALADTLYQTDHFSYTWSGVTGTGASLYRYYGPAGDVVLPSHIVYKDTIRPVSDVKYEFFDGYQGSLTGVVYPEGANVQSSTFENFTALNTVVLSGGAQSIGSKAFLNCTSLESINTGDIATIGSSAFEGCASLESIDLTSLKYLQSKTFAGCSSLKDITFGNALTRVSANAFSGTPITELTLPDSVTRIEYGFGGSSLTRIELPDSVNDLSGTAFTGLEGQLEYVRWPGGEPSVYANCFKGFTALKSVDLSSDTTSISSSAFQDCITLQSIDTSNVSTIYGNAFSGCTSLESIDLTSLEYLQSNTFAGCSNLQTILFSNALTRVSANAFAGTPITALVLPESVTRVDYSFKDSSLTSIELPDSVNNLSGTAFTGLETQLEYVRWPAGVTNVSGGSFKNHAALRNAILPEGVMYLGMNDSIGAFYGCTGMEHMNFPDTLEIIGAKSFMDCTNLSSVSFGSGLKMIRANAFTNTALTVVYLPAGVTNVASNAFPEGCVIVCPGGSTTAATLTSTKMAYRTPTMLDLPADLTVIEDGAFIGADAEMVIIPAGCTSIGSRAFADMPNLRYVRLPAGATVAADAFEGCDVVEVVEY